MPMDQDRRMRLRALWDSPRSLALIADELGSSVSAVLGAAGRMQLGPRPERAGMPVNKFDSRSRAARPGDTLGLETIGLDAPGQAARRAPGPIAPARTCQFPSWPDPVPPPRPPVFCGAPSAEGRSWCPACLSRVMTRPQLPDRVQDRLARSVGA